MDMVIGPIVKHMHIYLRSVKVVINRGKAGMEEVGAFVVDNDKIDHPATILYAKLWFACFNALARRYPLKDMPRALDRFAASFFI